jgi:hypothetical protein
MTTDGLPHQVRASAEAREAALRSEVAVLRARDATAENEVERCRRELYVEMEAKRLAYDLSPMPRLCEVNAQMAVALAAEQELKTALWATLLAVSAAVDPVLEATTSLPEPDGMHVMAPALPRPSSPAALPSAALGTAPTTAPTTALTTALTEQWVHAQQTAHAQQAAASAHQAAHAQHILASVGRVCTVCTSALDRLQLALANEAAVREEASRHRGKLEEMRRELGARALRIPADDH